jgi:hypothetical protein
MSFVFAATHGDAKRSDFTQLHISITANYERFDAS